jgi:hypothetical protein
MPDLEAKLATCFVSGGGNLTSLSEEQKRKVWATVCVLLRCLRLSWLGRGMFGGWWWIRLGRG